MSYGRKPYYIYDDGDCICFQAFKRIPNDAINQLIYGLLKDHRIDELKRRVKRGREIYLEALKEDKYATEYDIELEKSREDNIISDLLKEDDDYER